jgi:hypothetical protein
VRPFRRRRRRIGPEVIRASELTGISVPDLLAMGAQEATERLIRIGDRHLADGQKTIDKFRIRKDTP